MYSSVLSFVLSSLAFLGVHASSTGMSRRDTGTKGVFAHHMVGYTFSYTAADWTEDITAAQSAGLDGFALNVGVDSWQPGQVAAAYESLSSPSITQLTELAHRYAAAQAFGTGFKLFISLDLTYAALVIYSCPLYLTIPSF